MTTPAAEWVATDLDLRHNQLINAAAENRDTAPVDPVKGQLWLDTSTTPNVLRYWDGTAWTGGRAYSTVADDGVARTQRSKLDFRSTGSVAATVTDDGVNDASKVTLDAKFGPVVPTTIPGAAAVNGTAATVARSDHSHGAPLESGADVRLTSWWQDDRELWEQLSAPATFVADLPGQTVGGGWQLDTNGSVYWNGDLIPVVAGDVYFNSTRVHALGASAAMSMGWLCYDVDQQLLGQVKCSNQVPIVPDNEFDILVARNLVPSPSGETGSANWSSSGTVGYSSDRSFGTGSKSIKVTWPAGATQSSCVIRVPTPIPPNTPVTLSAQVYVPGGSPDVRLYCVEENRESPLITQKSQWAYVEVPPWTTSDDSGDQVLTVGIYTNTNTPDEVTTAYLDNVMLRVGDDPLPEGRAYFDGDTVPSGEDEIFVWDGEPHNSTSSYYTVAPSWEAVTGHVAIGEGAEPAIGTSAGAGEAVNPPPGTLYFRPFISCESGQILIDTHEVGRSPRELHVVDGLTVGWLTSEGPITAPEIVTHNISPPDTDPVVPMRIGPVQDPPEQGGDVVSRDYLERVLGLLPEEAAAPPQFLWSGDPGVDPQPADLGFPFPAWPLFSQWFDTSVTQAKITVLTGTFAYSSQPTPWAGTGVWKPLAESYRVVTTPPADGVLICCSTGVALTTINDYLVIRCGVWSGVDESGDGGSYVGSASETAGSSSGAATSRTGFTAFSFVAVTAGTRYMFRTEYSHGGGNSTVNRERVFGVYLPDATRMGAP